MKKITSVFCIIVLLVNLVSCVSVNKSNMDFVQYDKTDKEVKMVAINVPTKLAKPFVVKSLKNDNESKEMIDLVKNIKKIKVLTIENSSNEIENSFESYRLKEGIEELVVMNHEGNQVSILGKDENDQINRLLLNLKSKEGEVVFIDLKGKFKKSEIVQLSK